VDRACDQLSGSATASTSARSRMAVVVQRMVPSEASGALFTANPTSGDRDELVINASFGLGDAVVSGDVTRDRTS
jgi:phosphoenolpyruvate synthase/pyruvate phosphate dikinase